MKVIIGIVKFNFEKIIIALLTLLIVATAGFIFFNSCQNTEASYKRSDAITESVEPIVNSVSSSENTFYSIGSYVRKSAHLLEFMLLGAEGYLLAVIAAKKAVGMFSFAPLFGALGVAVADEYIQFYSDRTSLIKDVVLDFTGAVIGMLLILFGYLIYHGVISCKKKGRKKTAE